MPAAPLFEHTITGLDSEAAHNVRTRAGDDNGASAASPWSGPWLEAAPVAAAPLGSAEATDDPSFNEQQSVAAERVADESVAEDGVVDDSGAEHRFSDADSANIAAQKTPALTTRQNGNSAPAFADDAALVYVTPLDTLGDATGDTTNVSADRLAQSFQTGGTTADSFAVNKVEVPMAVPDGITVGVEIWSDFGVVARPGSLLFTLSAPAAFDNDVATVEEFEASEVSLTGGTWYWLVFSRMPAGGSGNIRIPRRDSGVVFTDESSGWGLSRPYYYSNDNWVSFLPAYAFKFAIEYTADRSVAENTVSEDPAAPIGVGAAITATDADNDTLTYSVVATDPADEVAGEHLTAFNEDFDLDAAEGEITVKTDATIDYEGRSSYVVQYRVSDGKDASGNVENPPLPDDTLTLTIKVANVDEPATLTFPAAPQVDTALTATLLDPDGVSASSWQWSRSSRPGAVFSNITDADSASYTPEKADRAYFLRATVTYSDGIGPNKTESVTTALTTGVPAEPFVKNTRSDEDQSYCDANPYGQGPFYQGFQTGDNPGGYLLTSVTVGVGPDPGPIQVRLYRRLPSAIGGTGPPVHELQPPRRIVSLADNTATALSGAVLDPNTTYYVRLDANTYRCTDTQRVDDGVASGWSIVGRVYLTPQVTNLRLRFVVSGLDLLGRPGPLGSLSATSGGSTSVELEWSEPGSTGQRPVTLYEVRHKQGSETTTPFGGWSDVLDSDNDGDLGDERTVTVPGLMADTEYTFEVRAVNSNGDGVPVQATATPDAAGILLHHPPAFSSAVYPGDAATRTVFENTVSADPDSPIRLGSAITATDADNDTLYYSVAATATDTAAADHYEAFNEDFQVDETTGAITVKTDATIDYETRTSYVVQYRVTDRENAAGTTQLAPTADDFLTLTIRVTNADEPGTVEISGDPVLGPTLTATLSDIDDVSGTPSWQWERLSRPDTAFGDVVSPTGASYNPTEDDKAHFLRATATYTDGHGAGKTASAVTASPWGVEPTYLVKNTRQPALTCNLGLGDRAIIYQGFRTGDNPAGYLLTNVWVYLARNSGNPIEVHLYERSGETGVGEFLVELQPPETIQDVGAHIVIAPPRTVLKPNRDYFVRLTNTGAYQCTQSHGFDSGGASGWSLIPRIVVHRPNDTPSNPPDHLTLRFQVYGVDLSGPPGPPGSLSTAAGAGSVVLSWSAPGSTGQSPITKYQMRHKKTAEPVENFSMWPDVADGSDAGSDLHDERSVTVSGLTAATEYTFEVRAVNADGDGVAARVTATPDSLPAFSATDYPGGAATRTVDENSTSGDAVGDPITAADADEDTLYYMVAATTDNDPVATAHLEVFNRHFELDDESGQISVKDMAKIDFEARPSYVVKYQVTDREDAAGMTQLVPTVDDSVTLTISVTNVDEAGTVTFSAADPTVGTALTATLSDPETVPGTPAWQWARSARPDSGFVDIDGATNGAYTPVKTNDTDDTAYFLRATATYTDGDGPDKSASAVTRLPVSVTAVALVEATGQSDIDAGYTNVRLAFRTGVNPVGYGLFRIGLEMKSVDSAVTSPGPVVIGTSAGADLRGDTVAVLEAPASLVASAVNYFTVPAGVTLEAGRQYVLRLGNTAGVKMLFTGDAVSVGLQGWTISSRILYGIANSRQEVPLVKIEGFALLGPPTVPAGLSAMAEDPTVPGAVTLGWSEPASTGQSPITKYQMRHKQGSETTTPFGAWSDVLDSEDPGEDLGDERSVTVTGLEGNTLYRFQVQALNSCCVSGAASIEGTPKPHTRPRFTGEVGRLDRTLAEDAAQGTEVGASPAQDADGDDVVFFVASTLSFQGQPSSTGLVHLAAFNRDFGVDPVTGLVTVKAGAMIDFETRDTYAVLYQVTDGENDSGEDEADNPPLNDDSRQLTITVTDVDEAGAVSISANPTVGAVLTATLADPDGAVSSQTWQWSRSDARSGPFADISGATSATYTPVAADDGKYLRAAVSYADVHGAGQSAEATTAAAVLAVAVVHTVPAFSAVDFPGDAAARSVAENVTAGDVGAAVAATDSDGDMLTYSVSAVSASIADMAHLAAFSRDFALNAGSGQITVRPGAVIDFETRSSYRVLYRVSDGEDAAGEPSPAFDDMVTLTINVANENEPGAVTVSGVPQVGAELTASLADPDGAASSAVWQWSRAGSLSGSFADISGATSATYTAVDADAGMYLRATATYTDALGAQDQTAAATTDAAVTSAPKFALEQGTEQVSTLDETSTSSTSVPTDHLAQSFATPGTVSDSFVLFGVRVALSVPAGQAAAASIWSNDASGFRELPGAVLPAGTLSATGAFDANVSTAEAFMSSSGIALAGGTKYWLVVSRTSLGGTGRMAISVVDAEEEFTDSVTGWSLGGYAFDQDNVADSIDWERVSSLSPLKAAILTGPTRTVAENAATGDVGLAITATDADGDTLTYSVAATTDSDGEAHLTAFNEDFGLDAATGQISVKDAAAIDYETRDTYTVLYRVTDSEDAAGEPSPAIDDALTLTVTVTNADEAGAVSISGTAQVGAVLTATLADPDGAVSSQTWQWSRSDAQSGPFTAIASADSATYTPVAADNGKYLKAAVSYADAHGAGQSAEATTAAAVRGTAPAFAAGAGLVDTAYVSSLGAAASNETDVPASRWAQMFTTGGTASDSFVVSGVRLPLGLPAGVSATAEIFNNVIPTPNDSEPGSLFASLGGPPSFDAVTSTVEVFGSSPGVTLTGGTTYWVVITRVSGNSNDQIRIPLLDARAAFTDSATGWSLGDSAYYIGQVGNRPDRWDDYLGVVPWRIAIDYLAPRTVAENTASGGVGPAVTAIDADGDTLVYSVAVTSDADGTAHLEAFNRDFALDAMGQISVGAAAAIDYEARSSYTVLYQVSDGKNAAGEPSPAIDDTVTLTINVANENEPGAVTVSGVPQVGAELTASLADPDGAVSSAVWQWSRADSPSGDFNNIDGATSAAHTPVSDDVGKFLQAAATYTDDTHGAAGQSAAATTAAAVVVAEGTHTVPAFSDAVDTVYVSSLGAAASNDTDVPTSRWAQMFTTGGTASDSFVVSGVRLPLGLPAGVSATAEIFDNVIPAPNDSEPGSSFASLGGPPSFDAVTSTVEVFGSSPGVTLAGGTTYWVVITRVAGNSNDRIRIPLLDATGAFTDSATGWSLGDSAYYIGQVGNRPDRWDDPSGVTPLKMAILTGPTRTVTENTATGDVGLAVTATDLDGDTLTYSVAAVSASIADMAHLTAFSRDFALNAGSGQITVRPAAVIDYETRSSYRVLYRVTDGEDAAGEPSPAFDDMVTLTINVANENEPGAVTVSGVPQVGAELTASLADPDGAASSAVWQWSRAGSLSGSFADISGATSATYTAVDADAGMYLRATATYTDALGAQDQTAAATTDAAVTSAPKFALEQGTEQVSTLDETSTSSTSVPTDHLAQSFATPGTVSDSFVLFGVRVALSVPAGQTAAASIWSNDASGFRELPGAVLPAGTLSATGAFDANVSTAEAFMSSSGIALAGGTKYWLVVSRTSLGGTGRMAISVVDAEEEFTDSVTGWSLGGYAFDQDNVADSIDWERVSSPSPLKAAILTEPTRTVAENATAGDVGAAVTATDADGDTLTYSVAATTGSDATEHLTAFNEDFGLDAATGQITVRPGAVIDFETRSSYRVLYQVTDSEDASGGTESTPAIDDSLTLTVTVTNANEAGAVSISGTAQVGAVLTATLADPDGAVSSQTWQWSRSDAQSGPFTAIAGADSATYTPVAADDGKYLRAAVSYADVHGAGQSAEATTAAVLAAAAVHTVPAFSAVDFPGDAAARSVAENATAGDVGAAVTATDADGDTLTYSVAATTGSDATEHLTAFNEDFGLDAATGQITVRPGAVIDFETRSSYRVLYQVTDSEDASGGTESTPAIDDSLTLTVTVTNANEAGAVSISGTAQVGAVLTATLADPDGSVSSQTWQWSRSDAQSGPFTAIASADSATYTPVAADDGKYLRAAVSYADVHGAGQSAEATTAAVLAAAAVHTVPAFSAVDFPGDAAARSVAENATAGDVGAAVTATDADGDTLTYSVAATTGSDATEHLTAFNEDFGLDAATGQITVRPGAVIDFETRSSYRVLYQVTDSEDAAGEPSPAIDDSLTLTVTVTNANEAGAVSISGTAQVGAVLTATLADPDGSVSSQTWQWSRSDAQSGPFTAIAGADSATYTPVAADDGKYLRAAVSYADVHGAGQSAEATTAAVLAAAAVHTVPAFSAADFPGDAAARSVAENATAGDVGAAVTATDADGDTLTYSVAATTGSDATEHLTAFNEDFGLDAATGQITVRPGAVIDFETRSSYRVLYQVTDSEDAAGEPSPAIDDSLTLTVTVTNANEAGAVSISGTAQVGAVLTATLADPDGSVSSQTWQWSRSDAQSGPFTAIASADSATYTPVAADDGKYLRAAVSYADVHGAGQSAEATTAAAVLAAAAVHTVPAFSAADFPGDAAARSVAENATAGDVGAAVTATDADGDTLTYSVAATTGSDATEHLTAFNEDFGLDAATGQITVRPGAVIDFETRSSYRVLYQVTDSEDARRPARLRDAGDRRGGRR